MSVHIVDGPHYSQVFEETADGWYKPVCSCGKKVGAYPDAETACDALMQHAYEAGFLDGRKNEQG